MVLSSRRRTAAMLLAFVVLASACVSVPLKQKATLSLQTAHTAIGLAQDVERASYASKTIDNLTPKVHGDFARFFEMYFTAESRVAQALITWRAGQAAPSGLAESMHALDDALRAAEKLTASTDASSLLGHLNRGIAEVQRAIVTMMGGR